MPRRRRRSKSGLSAGGFVVLILSLVFIAQKGWLALAVLWVFALVLWLAFFKKTQCDVETSKGEGCGRNAYGRLATPVSLSTNAPSTMRFGQCLVCKIRQSGTG